MGAAALAMIALPWRWCAAWMVSTLAIEFWGWFAGRKQYLGKPVATAERANYLAYDVALIAAWFGIAWMLWGTGRLDGAVAAAIIWISIVGFAQTFASRTPIGFTVCGVAPAAGAFAVALSDRRFDMASQGLVAGILALAMGFALAGARQTFAAGRRLEEAQGALKDSVALYRTLADSISDVVGCIATDGATWRYLSPSIEAMTGYTAAEFAALAYTDYVHPGDIQLVSDTFDAMVATGKPAKLQYRQFCKDGRQIWLETGFALVASPADGSPEVLCEIRDITARKALETELVEARVRAEAAAAAKADFLANMTHELRTPLNAIIGFSRVLAGSDALAARDARHAQLINEASATLLVVVNDVLDFSKLESGGFELDPQPCDPLAVAEAVAMLVEAQAQERGLRLSVCGAGENLKLVADGARLRQVLLNLVSNALKFTREGGVTIEVGQGPAAAPGQRTLRIKVIDTGIGIPDDKLEAVFERFSQADASVSRQFGGTGLGLAICRRIVSQMGGDIGAASQVGQGSTFWFEVTLPVAEETGAAQAAGTVQADAGPDRPVRLLLVEDVHVNRELVRVILEPFAVDIATAENGVEAIEAVAREAYDLVLMDVQMPVMDGLTAARHIRAAEDRAARRLPIVAMTANVLPEQIERCVDAGMDGHIGKPINPAELLAVIARWTAADDTAEAEPERATG